MNTKLNLPQFGQIEASHLLALDDLFAVVSDKFPISPGHTLIIARRAAARFHDLTPPEKGSLLLWIDWAQHHLTSKLRPAPNAFNLGINDGPAAGQTISQFHFHIIPRFSGDVRDPRGGIRQIIPSKANYWKETDIPDAEFFIRFDSVDFLSKPHKWTGNDDTNRNYNRRLDLKHDVFDLVLYWRASSTDEPRLVGCYRLHLRNLLRGGYIRPDRPGKVRVRFVHADDGQIYIQTKKNAPRLHVGK